MDEKIFTEELLRIGNSNNWEMDLRHTLIRLLISEYNPNPEKNIYKKIKYARDFLEKNQSIILFTIENHEKWCLDYLFPIMYPELRNLITQTIFHKDFDNYIQPSTIEIVEAINYEKENKIKNSFLFVFKNEYFEYEDYNEVTLHHLENGVIKID